MAEPVFCAWDWMLAAYGRPGVAEICLALQDVHGQNVPFLLWAAWSGADAGPRLERAAQAAHAWDEAAVSPLRAVRRALKAPRAPVHDAAREALRAEVKVVELAAERVLVETLQSLGGPPAGSASVLSALTAASRAWGRTAPKQALAALSEALA
jgi:uncharacterized protein (TIGR02444 family)